MERAAAIQKAIVEIVKLQAKQTVNNALYHCNGFDITLVYDLPLNFKVLVWHKSGNWNRPYRLLAVENETCYIQLPSRPIRFKSISIKPYFRPKTTYDAKLDELEAPAKLNELEVPLPTLEVPCKLTKPAVKYS